ncbi:MAG: hypothetical protein LBT06_08340 [Hungatella sp.]|nr:hypothetical protein [Hungatella sp.]
MEYFLIKSDNRIRYPLYINADMMDFETDEAFTVYVDFQSNPTFVDYFSVKKLFQYAFCVSDALKETLDIYTDNLSAVPFFVTDTKMQGQSVYWKVNIELKDCLVMKPNMKYDNLTIDKGKLKNKHIFRVAFEKQEYLIVSLNLAENILRKNAAGMQFFQVNVQ